MARPSTRGVGSPSPRTVPFLPQNTIRRRESLYERLSAGLGRRLIIVHAGPGFGKTAFLASFVQEQGGLGRVPAAWLALGRLHRDRVHLLEHLVFALREVHPGIGDVTLESISRGREALRRWDYHLELFCQEVFETVRRRTLVVLDQYEKVASSPGAIETIDYLVSVVPRNLTILLSTRQWPDLPSIPRLRTQGEVCELTAGDLCFTADEVSPLFSQQFGVSLSEKALADLVSRTGGWPALIQMAGSLAQSKGEQALPGLTGSLPMVYDYLEKEVFAHESPGARSFLMSTALVDQIGQDLGRALALDGESLAAFARLERGDFFASPIEIGTERYYQYNPVFQDFLLVKLGESFSADRIRDLHARLAELYRGAEKWDAAIHHLLQAGEYLSVSELIASLAPSAIAANNVETLARWIDAFPSEERNRSPWLLLYRGVVHRVKREWEPALLLYNRAADIFREKGENVGLTQALWYASQVLAYRRNQRLAVTLAGEALSHLNPSDVSSRAWMLRNIGNCHFDLGQTDEALRCHREAREMFAVVGDSHGEMLQSLSIALCLHQLGHLAESQQHYLQALGLQARTGDVNVLCWVQAGLARVRSMRGEYADSLAGLGEALEIARLHHLRPAEAFALVGLVDVHLDLGNYEMAEDCCREALAACEEFDDDGPRIDVRLRLMDLDLRKGRPDLARRQSLSVEAQIAASNLEVRKLSHSLLLASVSLAERQYWEAEQHVRLVRELASKVGAKCHLAEASYLLARVHFQRGDSAASASALGEMLDAVGDGGYVAFLLRDRQAASDLLTNALRQAPGWGQLAALLTKLANVKQGDAVAALAEAVPALEGVVEVAAAEPAPDLERTDVGVVSLSLVVTFLGPLRVQVGERVVTDRAWRTSKAKELFAYLLTRGESGASRDELLEVLWPELSTDSAVSNFHFTLHSLRRALEPHLTSGSSSTFLVLRGRRYRLELPTHASVDVRQFKMLVAKGSKLLRDKRPADAVPLLERAVELYKGDYLADLYVDWVEPDRRELLALYLNALRQLAWASYAQRDYDQVCRHAAAILSKDSYVEDAHRLLMRVACEIGNPAVALRQYDRLFGLLRSELGTEPGSATQRLYRQIRDGTYKRPSSEQLALIFERRKPKS